MRTTALLVLLGCVAAFAADTDSTARRPSDVALARLPLRIGAGMPVVRAMLNETAAYDFVVDTGSTVGWAVGSTGCESFGGGEMGCASVDQRASSMAMRFALASGSLGSPGWLGSVGAPTSERIVDRAVGSLGRGGEGGAASGCVVGFGFSSGAFTTTGVIGSELAAMAVSARTPRPTVCRGALAESRPQPAA